jgi:hypothetical protein
MISLEELKKEAGIQLLFSLLVISGAICPGVLAIWNYAPDFIEKCGSVKLLLLAGALTLPLLAINTIAVVFLFQAAGSAKSLADFAGVGMVIGAFVSMATEGIPLAFCYFAGWPAWAFALIVLCVETLWLLLAGVVFKPRKPGAAKK